MKKVLIIFVSLVLVILIVMFVSRRRRTEGFDTISLPKTYGEYSESVDRAILDTFPQIGKNEVSNESSATLWWHYPIFSLPSFKQQTNNLRYFKNPDEGTCARAEFCGAVYHDIKNKSNEVFPLAPVEEGGGARVGYFRTEPNELWFSIPTNQNILY
jgi:hypothetical protein